MTDRPHGYARYKLDGCRCYTCGWAVAQYRDQREHAIRRGTWHPFVNAEPARQHVANLKTCGFGDRTIAELAGLDRKAIRILQHGRPERGTPPPTQIRPTTAAGILGVDATFDNLPGATVINAAGTTRRLQALVAAGWPQNWLAARVCWTPANLGVLLRREQTIVRTARTMRDLFAELEYAIPVESGVPQSSVSRARAVAIAHRWAPAAAWDEESLDDPQAEPEWTGECGTNRGYEIHLREKTPTCPRCRAAHNELNRKSRSAA